MKYWIAKLKDLDRQKWPVVETAIYRLHDETDDNEARRVLHAFLASVGDRLPETPQITLEPRTIDLGMMVPREV